MDDLSPALAPKKLSKGLGLPGPELSDLPGVELSDPAPRSDARTAMFLQDLVLESTDVDQFLSNLARVAAKYLSHPGQDVFCGVTLLRPRHAKTLASSGPAALILDELQYAYGDGPCLTAARTHQIVHVRDTRTDQRWPQYFEAIADRGMLSILGVPIPLDGEADCALNLYCDTADGFTSEAVEAADVFAREASRSLRLAVRIAQLTDKANNLNAAMASRTIIDLAAGIIMGQNKCSQTKAINIMKTAANHRQMKLRNLAAELVAGVSNEPPTTHFD